MTERPSLYVHRVGEGLFPESSFDASLIRDLDAGKRLKAVVTMPRSEDRLRFYFACLTLVRDNLDNPPSKKMLHDAIKVRMGYAKTIKGVGPPIILPDSVAFDEMPEETFKDFLRDFKRLVTETIIPGLDSAQFEAAAREMLGERG